MIRARVLNRFTLKGTIDNHDPIGVTFRITGGLQPFRLTVISANWGRGYDPGEFKANVERVLNKVGEREYVVLLIQELDEADGADEHRIFEDLMEPGTTLVGWVTREPIAVSPGVKVTRKRRTLTMEQGTKIGAPVGTGPRRYLVSCIATIEGVRIGLGNQHPHRNLVDAKVQHARRRGERVTREVVADLLEHCDLVIHGGDMNDRAYPKAHPRERIVHSRDLDTIRLVTASGRATPRRRLSRARRTRSTHLVPPRHAVLGPPLPVHQRGDAMTIWNRITREPALVTSAVRAGLYCAVLFGLPLTDEQTAAVLLAVEAVLALVTRAVVTPSAEVVVQKKPDEVTQTAGPAADVETGAPVHAQITKILGKA